MSKQDSVTSAAFMETSLRGKWWEQGPGQREAEGKSEQRGEKDKESEEGRGRCQRERGGDRGEQNDTDWSLWETGTGKSGKTESGERLRIRAGREMNPMTLLGSRQAAPSAPRIATATEMQPVLWAKPSPHRITAGRGSHTSLSPLSASCLMAFEALNHRPTRVSDGRAPVKAQGH